MEISSADLSGRNRRYSWDYISAGVARRAKRFVRDVTNIAYYNRHLSNGINIWLKQRYSRSLPSFRFRNGMTWYHGPRDEPVLLFEEIYIDRFYEPLEAPKNANVIDIGANIGLVTLFWTDGRTDLRFHAYEPNSEAYATLRRNVECNSHLTSQVRTFQEAVGRTRGQLELWVDVPTTLATAYGDAPVQGARKASFPMITLDDAWDRLDRAPIWMLKIDTEGAEGDILEGASDAVLASVQNACVEWHDNLVPGVYERCRKRLEDSGFTLQIRAHPWNEGIILARRGAALVGRVGALTN